MTRHTNRQEAFYREHREPVLSAPQLRIHPWDKASEPSHPAQKPCADSAKYALRTLLVPLDGTQHAEHALPHALAIARRSRAKVRLVHVYPHMQHVEPWQMCAVDEWNHRAKLEAYNYLVEVAARVARTDSITVETRLIDSVDTVGALAKESAQADLVVMASRRRGFLRRLFSPSVSNGLRRRIRTPGLFVKGYSHPVDLTGDPIARHILVPLNGTLLAERVLDVAAKVSRLQGAKLSLINVQNHDWSLGSFEHSIPSTYLSGIADEVKRAGPRVDAHVVTTERSAATAVTAFAQQRNVDLIALSTRCNGDWAHVLQGNFADELLRKTNLPLLVLGIDGQRQRAEITTVVES